MKSTYFLILSCALFLSAVGGIEQPPAQHWVEAVECETVEEPNTFQQCVHSSAACSTCTRSVRVFFTSIGSTLLQFDQRLFILQQSLRI